MDNFLKQLCCQKGNANSQGEIVYTFSLDVLIPNAIAFGGGFCLEWFLLHDVMFGGKK